MNVLKGTLVLSLKTPKVTGWNAESDVPFLNWKVKKGSSVLLVPLSACNSSASDEA